MMRRRPSIVKASIAAHAAETEAATLSIKELKAELDELQVGYADCFEKSELVKRLLGARKGGQGAAAGGTSATKAASGSSAGGVAAKLRLAFDVVKTNQYHMRQSRRLLLDDGAKTLCVFTDTGKLKKEIALATIKRIDADPKKPNVLTIVFGPPPGLSLREMVKLEKQRDYELEFQCSEDAGGFVAAWKSLKGIAGSSAAEHMRLAAEEDARSRQREEDAAKEEARARSRAEQTLKWEVALVIQQSGGAIRHENIVICWDKVDSTISFLDLKGATTKTWPQHRLVAIKPYSSVTGHCFTILEFLAEGSLLIQWVNRAHRHHFYEQAQALAPMVKVLDPKTGEPFAEMALSQRPHEVDVDPIMEGHGAPAGQPAVRSSSSKQRGFKFA